jgi:hypothetical protein
MTTEQTELIEKLNCLEFETSQLSHAYQQWRSYVEQGTAPPWMAAAIRITHDALMTFCLDSVSAPALGTSPVDEIECYALSGETAPALGPALPAEDSITTLCLHEGQRSQRDDPEIDPRVRTTALLNGSRVLTPVRQNRIVGMLALADVPLAFSPRQLELEAAAGEIPGILVEERATAEPSPELLPMTESDWSESMMPVAISSASTANVISEQTAIQLSQQEERGAEQAAIRSLATVRLPNWLQGSSIAKVLGAASVAFLMAAGGAIGIYLASPQHATPIVPVRAQASGVVAVPNGAEAELKFDRDPVAAPLGGFFVLSAVLSRGSDIASVSAEIDYDANLLEFMGVSQGGFLVKSGRQVVLAQRNDPLTGVLKISAEQPPGTPGISGDGQVFALSFHAKKKGKGTVSIIPSAHDSEGQRIEMAGTQVSLHVN